VVLVPTIADEVANGAAVTVLEALQALPHEDRTSTKWQAMADAMGVSRPVFFRAKKSLLNVGRVGGGGGRGALYQVRKITGEVEQ
jgi:hypothetical protein